MAKSFERCFGFVARTRAVVVDFKAVGTTLVGYARIALRISELYVAAIPEIGVEIIVERAIGDQVFTIDRAAEPLECVVAGIRNLYVFDGGFGTHTAKREAVDLVVGLEGDARVFDTYKTQNTGVVQRVVTAVRFANTAFHDLLAGRNVDGGFATNNNATPIYLDYIKFQQYRLNNAKAYMAYTDKGRDKNPVFFEVPQDEYYSAGSIAHIVHYQNLASTTLRSNSYPETPKSTNFSFKAIYNGKQVDIKGKINYKIKRQYCSYLPKKILSYFK